MSRTELERIARQITSKPTDTYSTPHGYGTIYEGLYNRRPFLCVYDELSRLCAICYNKVMYLLIGTGNLTITYDIKILFTVNNCEARVYLYRNSTYRLFEDVDGSYKSASAMHKSFACDYRDVIPIPAL